MGILRPFTIPKLPAIQFGKPCGKFYKKEYLCIPKNWEKFFQMERFKEYSIPVSGLKPGFHEYRFEMDPGFFSHFEKSPLADGRFKAEVLMDRRQDLAVLDFRIEGSYACACDRCLAPIELPVHTEYRLILKFEEGKDEDDVIYLDAQASEWNAAQLIYELIIMAMPLTNVYDCKGIPCNQDVLRQLEKTENAPGGDASVWEDLKKIKLN